MDQNKTLDIQEQKEAVQEVPVLEQPMSGVAFEMHIRMQRTQAQKDKKGLEEHMKPLQERVSVATGDHGGCLTCMYLGLCRQEIAALDVPPITREVIEKFYERVCQVYQRYQHLVLNGCDTD